MASSRRMMWAIIMFCAGTTINLVLVILGNPLLTYFNNLLMAQTISPLLADSLGTLMGWVTGFYYMVILIMEIGLIYRVWQESAAVGDYFPDVGVL